MCEQGPSQKLIALVCGIPVFDTVAGLAYTAWEASTDLVTPQDVTTALGPVPNPLVLGQHARSEPDKKWAFSCQWDFTSSGSAAGNPDA